MLADVTPLWRRIKETASLTFLVSGTLLINTGVTLYFHTSPLLSNIFFGTVLFNIDKIAFRFFKFLNTVDWPFYVVSHTFLSVPIWSSITCESITLKFFCISSVNVYFLDTINSTEYKKSFCVYPLKHKSPLLYSLCIDSVSFLSTPVIGTHVALQMDFKRIFFQALKLF